MKKIIIFFLLTSSTVSVALEGQHEFYNIDELLNSDIQANKNIWLSETRPSRLTGKVYGIFTHNSDKFDSSGKTKTSSGRLLNLFNNSQIPTIIAVDDISSKGLDGYFFAPILATYKVYSTVGSLNISFPYLERVILSGGFFELCFDQTMENIAANSMYGQSIRFDLVTDAIFHHPGVLMNRLANLGIFKWRARQLTKKILKYGLLSLSDKTILNYFKTYIFSLYYDGNTMGDMLLRQYTISIYKEDQFIGKYGNGPQSLEVNLTKMENIRIKNTSY